MFEIDDEMDAMVADFDGFCFPLSSSPPFVDIYRGRYDSSRAPLLEPIYQMIDQASLVATSMGVSLDNNEQAMRGLIRCLYNRDYCVYTLLHAAGDLVYKYMDNRHCSLIDLACYRPAIVVDNKRGKHLGFQFNVFSVEKRHYTRVDTTQKTGLPMSYTDLVNDTLRVTPLHYKQVEQLPVVRQDLCPWLVEDLYTKQAEGHGAESTIVSPPPCSEGDHHCENFECGVPRPRISSAPAIVFDGRACAYSCDEALIEVKTLADTVLSEGLRDLSHDTAVDMDGLDGSEVPNLVTCFATRFEPNDAVVETGFCLELPEFKSKPTIPVVSFVDRFSGGGLDATHPHRNNVPYRSNVWVPNRIRARYRFAEISVDQRSFGGYMVVHLNSPTDAFFCLWFSPISLVAQAK